MATQILSCSGGFYANDKRLRAVAGPVRPEELEIGVPKLPSLMRKVLDSQRLKAIVVERGCTTQAGVQEPFTMVGPGPGAGTVATQELLARTWLMGCAERGAPPAAGQRPTSSISLCLSVPSCRMPMSGQLSTAPAVGRGGVCKWDGAVRRLLLTSAIRCSPAARAVPHASLTSPRASTPPPPPPPSQSTAGLAPGCSLMAYAFTLASYLHQLYAQRTKEAFFFHLKIISDL